MCSGLDPHHKAINRATRREHERGATHQRCQGYRKQIDDDARKEQEATDNAYADTNVMTGIHLEAAEVQPPRRPAMQFDNAGPTAWDDEFGLGGDDGPWDELTTRETESLRILEELEQWGRYLEEEFDPEEPLDEDGDDRGDEQREGKGEL